MSELSGYTKEKRVSEGLERAKIRMNKYKTKVTQAEREWEREQKLEATELELERLLAEIQELVNCATELKSKITEDHEDNK